MQGKSLATQQITAEVKDNSKMFKLLGSHGLVIYMYVLRESFSKYMYFKFTCGNSGDSCHF